MSISVTRPGFRGGGRATPKRRKKNEAKNWRKKTRD